MYPTISFFLKEVFGINFPLPIQTYGFMVALAFLTGALIMSREFKRKENEGIFLPVYKKIKEGEPASTGSIISSLIVGFLLGFKLVEAAFNWGEFSDNPQDFILSGRGNFIGGVLIGIGSAFYTWWEKNRKKLNPPITVEKEILPHQMSGNILVVAGIAGLLGAKIFHILENFQLFLNDPIGEFLSFQGLTFLGGLLVGSSVVFYYLYKNNISIIHSLDIMAVAVPIAYAVGRGACQLSGDGCWGIQNPNPKPEWLSWLPDFFWAYNYPNNVNDVGSLLPEYANVVDCKYCHVLDVPVFPTPVYESTMMIIIFVILWSLRKRIKIPALLFSIFLMFMGIERFLIEQIRVNNEYNFLGGVTQAEIISTFLFLSGLASFIFVFIKREKIKEFVKVKYKDINKRTLKHKSD